VHFILKLHIKFLAYLYKFNERMFFPSWIILIHNILNLNLWILFIFIKQLENNPRKLFNPVEIIRKQNRS